MRGHRLAVAAALTAAAFPAAAATAAERPRPTIHQRPIPYGAERKADMRAYSVRHYGLDRWQLRAPKVIVEHVAVTSSLDAIWSTFAPNRADRELREKPGVCAHFAIGGDGRIEQLVPLGTMCRHTVGLNYTAIGIEHTGFSDADVLHNRRQLTASWRLTAWLRCRFEIRRSDVIGHNENRSSPYHRERVARLKNQTHDDFTAATMRAYRRGLDRRPC